MKKIGVNDGHTISGYGTGAVGFIVESEETRKVGNEVRKLLKERGYVPYNCTIDYANSVNESLSLVVQQANREELDWFISIHFNAGKGKGVEVYTYEGRQHQDAIDVCNNISSVLGIPNRGVKVGTGLYVIKRTKAKSMLIEVCFVDSDDAEKYIKKGYKAVAEAIVNALVGYIEKQPVSKIQYEAHIQNIGWQGVKSDGQTAGTVGESKRLEALRINCHGIKFKGHVQNIGWTSERVSGEIIGTAGEDLRLEAVQIFKDDIKYRVHIQNKGWTEWKNSGEIAGTVGESLRIEAIEIKF